MTESSNALQAQFSGFSNTPHLFKSSVSGLKPFLDPPKRTLVFNAEFNEKLRLGLRVERFVSEELKGDPDISILKENHQVRAGKLTIGELDCLLLKNNKPIHLEIQFKYYLINPSLGDCEIDQCIGPMRKDSLRTKLNKLKEKQLPLLFAPETKTLLNELNLKSEAFEQFIYFKAQLFVPLGVSISLETLNPNCIYGFYFNYSNLTKFQHCKFYKPRKLDWLLDVSPHVSWMTLDKIKPDLEIYEAEKYAPLLWLKYPNGEITKCFVVPW